VKQQLVRFFAKVLLPK